MRGVSMESVGCGVAGGSKPPAESDEAHRGGSEFRSRSPLSGLGATQPGALITRRQGQRDDRRSRVCTHSIVFVLGLLLGAPIANARALVLGPVVDPSPAAVLKDVGIDQRLNEPLPLDLTFRDEAGHDVQLGQYFGRRPVILALVYYECPMLCTLTLNGLASALRVLSFNAGNQFEVVVVSFNPAETPALAAAKKKAYLERYDRPGTEDGWHFLTGDDAAIKRLTAAAGFRYTYVAAQKQYAHAAGIIVATPQGRIARYFFGVEYAPRDLRLGLVEASQNQIGSAVDQLLLYCFHYDPATGKYGAIVLNIMRLGGAATVLALGAFMIIMWRRERRHAPPGVIQP